MAGAGFRISFGSYGDHYLDRGPGNWASWASSLAEQLEHGGPAQFVCHSRRFAAD
jgi:hypothetical protein